MVILCNVHHWYHTTRQSYIIPNDIRHHFAPQSMEYITTTTHSISDPSVLFKNQYGFCGPKASELFTGFGIYLHCVYTFIK